MYYFEDGAMSKRKQLLAAFILLLSFAPALSAQVAPGYAVIDGTQNPPQIIFSNINVVVTRNGTGAGNYVLDFDNPVVFFAGTSLTAGGGFDAGDTVLTAVVDLNDASKVNVKTRYVGSSATDGHSPYDARFSIEVHF